MSVSADGLDEFNLNVVSAGGVSTVPVGVPHGVDVTIEEVFDMLALRAVTTGRGELSVVRDEFLTIEQYLELRHMTKDGVSLILHEVEAEVLVVLSNEVASEDGLFSLGSLEGSELCPSRLRSGSIVASTDSPFEDDTIAVVTITTGEGHLSGGIESTSCSHKVVVDGLESVCIFSSVEAIGSDEVLSLSQSGLLGLELSDEFVSLSLALSSGSSLYVSHDVVDSSLAIDVEVSEISSVDEVSEREVLSIELHLVGSLDVGVGSGSVGLHGLNLLIDIEESNLSVGSSLGVELSIVLAHLHNSFLVGSGDGVGLLGDSLVSLLVSHANFVVVVIQSSSENVVHVLSVLSDELEGSGLVLLSGTGGLVAIDGSIESVDVNPKAVELLEVTVISLSVAVEVFLVLGVDLVVSALPLLNESCISLVHLGVSVVVAFLEVLSLFSVSLGSGIDLSDRSKDGLLLLSALDVGVSLLDSSLSLIEFLGDCGLVAGNSGLHEVVVSGHFSLGSIELSLSLVVSGVEVSIRNLIDIGSIVTHELQGEVIKDTPGIGTSALDTESDLIVLNLDGDGELVLAFSKHLAEAIHVGTAVESRSEGGSIRLCTPTIDGVVLILHVLHFNEGSGSLVDVSDRSIGDSEGCSTCIVSSLSSFRVIADSSLNSHGVVTIGHTLDGLAEGECRVPGLSASVGSFTATEVLVSGFHRPSLGIVAMTTPTVVGIKVSVAEQVGNIIVLLDFSILSDDLELQSGSSIASPVQVRQVVATHSLYCEVLSVSSEREGVNASSFALFGEVDVHSASVNEAVAAEVVVTTAIALVRIEAIDTCFNLLEVPEDRVRDEGCVSTPVVSATEEEVLTIIGGLQVVLASGQSQIFLHVGLSQRLGLSDESESSGDVSVSVSDDDGTVGNSILHALEQAVSLIHLIENSGSVDFIAILSIELGDFLSSITPSGLSGIKLSDEILITGICSLSSSQKSLKLSGQRIKSSKDASLVSNTGTIGLGVVNSSLGSSERIHDSLQICSDLSLSVSIELTNLSLCVVKSSLHLVISHSEIISDSPLLGISGEVRIIITHELQAEGIPDTPCISTGTLDADSNLTILDKHGNGKKIFTISKVIREIAHSLTAMTFLVIMERNSCFVDVSYGIISAIEQFSIILNGSLYSHRIETVRQVHQLLRNLESRPPGLCAEVMISATSQVTIGSIDYPRSSITVVAAEVSILDEEGHIIVLLDACSVSRNDRPLQS